MPKKNKKNGQHKKNCHKKEKKKGRKRGKKSSIKRPEVMSWAGTMPMVSSQEVSALVAGMTEPRAHCDVATTTSLVHAQAHAHVSHSMVCCVCVLWSVVVCGVVRQFVVSVLRTLRRRQQQLPATSSSPCQHWIVVGCGLWVAVACGLWSVWRGVRALPPSCKMHKRMSALDCCGVLVCWSVVVCGVFVCGVRRQYTATSPPSPDCPTLTHHTACSVLYMLYTTCCVCVVWCLLCAHHHQPAHPILVQSALRRREIWIDSAE